MSDSPDAEVTVSDTYGEADGRADIKWPQPMTGAKFVGGFGHRKGVKAEGSQS
jgi:hypothetical protein